jgi:hypothetical protein
MSYANETFGLIEVMQVPKWLCHRSRHCFPLRPAMECSLDKFSAIRAQLFVPYFMTICRMASSSFMTTNMCE